ncbi:MAG: hypothetical protein CMC76_09025 [Flavobacteriaceae bacterium]|nr:hypothetical protein [Flavobacteriaceae bacterium]|tara:strand:+ start:2602 stop:3294 length:693 start_codon:yes stop_codon:yes gene_type:complete
MHKELILKAFKSGEEILKKNGSNNPSINSISEHIATFLTEDLKYSTHSRTLRNYYKTASEEEEINISRIETVNGLCKYIGFKDYNDFINSQKTVDVSTVKKENKKNFLKKIYLFGFIVIVTVLTTVLLFLNNNEPKFMIWKIDHYEEVELDLNKYKLSDLKVYKQERIDNFKKIQPDSNYHFFNSDGTERVWYGKNNDKEYEFFTDYGRHPETGKNLKPITKYIINKYIK